MLSSCTVIHIILLCIVITYTAIPRSAGIPRGIPFGVLTQRERQMLRIGWRGGEIEHTEVDIIGKCFRAGS